MIVLLLWSAGFAALVYEGIRHGVFTWTAQASWALLLAAWWIVGALALARRRAAPRARNADQGSLIRAVREQAARDRAEQQRHESQL